MKNMYKGYIRIAFVALAFAVLLGIAAAATLISKQITNEMITCSVQKGEPACRASGCYWDGRNNECIPLTPYVRCIMNAQCEYCTTASLCAQSPGECYWFAPLNQCDYR